MADDDKTNDKTDDKSDDVDPETKFFALLDKWADNREANRPKNKTNAPQPRSILDELFGH